MCVQSIATLALGKLPLVQIVFWCWPGHQLCEGKRCTLRLNGLRRPTLWAWPQLREDWDVLTCPRNAPVAGSLSAVKTWRRFFSSASAFVKQSPGQRTLSTEKLFENGYGTLVSVIIIGQKISTASSFISSYCNAMNIPYRPIDIKNY